MSSKTQATEDRESLAGQLKEGIELCERKGWQVVARLVVPGITRSHIDLQDAIAAVDEALNSDRSGLFARQLDELGADAPNAYRRLAELIEARRVDVVVCRSRDRLGRTDSLVAGIEERLRRAGASVYSLAMPPTGTVEGDLYVSAVERASSQHYVVKLVHATRRGMDNRAVNGLLLSGPAPFGYREDWRMVNGRLVRCAAKDEREAEAYRWAVSETLARSLRQVDVLERLRDRFPERQWSASALRGILRSPFYLGLVVRRRVRTEQDRAALKVVTDSGPMSDVLWPEVEAVLLRRAQSDDRARGNSRAGARVHVVSAGMHEALIDMATWLELQGVLDGRSKMRRPASPRGLWAGLLWCGVCGERMYVDARRQGDKEYVSYRCGSRQTGQRCGNRGVSEWKMTTEIVRYLEVMLETRSEHLEPGIDERSAIAMDRAEALRREIGELRERQSRLVLLFETGRIGLDEFDARRADVDGKLARHEDELVRLELDVGRSERRKSRLELLREVLPDIERRLLDVPAGEANRLLRQIFTAIYVEDGKVKGVEVE